MITKSVLQHLEFRITQKVVEGVDEDIHAQKVASYCSEATDTIKSCQTVMTKYEEYLTGVTNVQIPELRVSRESCYKIEPMCFNAEIKGLTHFVTNLTLQPNLYCLQDRQNNTTEFLKVTTHGE